MPCLTQVGIEPRGAPDKARREVLGTAPDRWPVPRDRLLRSPNRLSPPAMHDPHVAAVELTRTVRGLGSIRCRSASPIAATSVATTPRGCSAFPEPFLPGAGFEAASRRRTRAGTRTTVRWTSGAGSAESSRSRRPLPDRSALSRNMSDHAQLHRFANVPGLNMARAIMPAHVGKAIWWPGQTASLTASLS